MWPAWPAMPLSVRLGAASNAAVHPMAAHAAEEREQLQRFHDRLRCYEPYQMKARMAAGCYKLAERLMLSSKKQQSQV
jgi:hypothetical protein